MAGAWKYLTLNGQRFGVANDTEPKVVKGGIYGEEVEAYGDGVHVTNNAVVPGKITDLQVRLQTISDDHNRLDALAKLEQVAFVGVAADTTYQATGKIVPGAEGLIKNSRNEKSEIFTFIATVGNVIEI